MSNFTKTGGDVKVRRANLDVWCCSNGLSTRLSKSMKAIAFVMLFMFSYGTTLAQEKPIEQAKNALRVLVQETSRCGETGRCGEAINGCITDAPEAPTAEEVQIQLQPILLASAGTIFVSHSENVVGDNCDWTVTHTYTVTCNDDDNDGFLFDLPIVYFGGDDIAPIITTEEVGGELGCNPETPSPIFTATDNCSDEELEVTVTPGQITEDGCFRSQTFTANVLDACDNAAESVSVTYTWTEDTEAPVINTFVGGGDLGCNPEVIPTPAFFATDNCGDITPDVSEGDIIEDGCFRSKTYTGTAMDACENEAIPVEITYTWTVDDEKPVIASNVQSGELECNPEEITAPVFTATDNCSAETIIEASSDGVIADEVGCGVSQTWTANYTDDCGNIADEVSITYTWTVDDEKPVIASNVQSGELECNPEEITAPVFTATDNCSAESIIEASSDGVIADEVGCGVSQTWTANYTDDCGNVADEVSITYTWIVDNEKPVIASNVQSGELECNPEEITAPVFTATDNCSAEVTLEASSDGPIADEGGCGFSQTWTANYTDDCGNPADEVSITYTWTVDNEKPVITAACARILDENECYGSEVLAYTPGLTKSGGVIAPNRTDPSKGLGAPQNDDTLNFVTLGYGGEIVIGFPGRVYNNPGNDISVLETSFGGVDFSEYPESAEVWVAMEDGVFYQIGQDVTNAFGSFDISDASTALPYITQVKLLDNTPSGSTSQDGYDLDGIVALNGCSNSSGDSDNDLGCNPDLEGFDPGFEVSDNCSEGGTATVTTDGPVADEDGCGYSITYTANYTDDCGNVADAVSCTYTYTVDTEKPVITVGSDGDSDGEKCYGSEVLSYTPGTTKSGGAIAPARMDATKGLGAPQDDDTLNFVSLGYGGEIVIGFPGRVYDNPGNDISILETSFGGVDFNQYPERADVYVSMDGITFFLIGEDVTNVFGDYDIALASLPYITQVKLIDTTPAESTSQDGYDLDGIVAINGCSSSSADDNNDLGCNPESIPVPSFAVIDNCDTEIEVDVETTETADGCFRSITYTATAEDECGNDADPVSVTYTWTEDNDAPTVDVEAQPLDLECNDEGNSDAIEAYLANNGGAVANDACGDVTWSFEILTSAEGDCGTSDTYLFTATDACGNTSSTEGTINVTDTQGPEFDFAPDDVTVQCIEDVPAPNEDVTATDVCFGNATVTSVDDQAGEDCDATITRTWTATDDCGNDTVYVQTIFVKDTTAPVIECLASSLEEPIRIPEVNCQTSWDIVYYLDVQLSDNCSPTVATPTEITRYSDFNEMTDEDGNLLVIGAIRYAAEDNLDACGNPAEEDCIVYFSYLEPGADSGPMKSAGICKTTEYFDGRPQVTERCDSLEVSAVEFTAYPVPFDNEINIGYSFDYDTKIVIKVYDTRGVVVSEVKTDNYIAGTKGNTTLDLSRVSTQMLYVKLETDRGEMTKKVISSGK